MAGFDWGGTSVTGDLFGGPISGVDAEDFCTIGQPDGYRNDECGTHEWTDNSNIISITYKGLPGRRYGYMGKPPNEYYDTKYNNKIPKPIITVKSMPQKCVYEERAKFYVVFNGKSKISFFGTTDQPPYRSGYNPSGIYEDIGNYVIQNPWQVCTPDFVKASFKNKNETYVQGDEDYTGATISNWKPINVEGTTRTSMIQKVVDEVNILGVTIFTPLFSTTTPDKCEC